ncbi:MAG: Uma2 family endonuclease [Synechococcaceae cyanobacterium]|nr:Uma2 family endonuclease [Synechococcaceae cyanobacterium]
MLAPLNPREMPGAAPPGPGILSADQPFSALTLPVALTDSLRLTPEQFEQLCQVNPEAVLELAADGHLIAMTPTGGDTGARSGELFFQIKTWARARGGWMAFDSSTGFRLPDDAVLSPDASLVALERWQALTPEQRRRIPPLCPDLVVELVSPSDEAPRGLAALRQKMAAYQRNGARLGWLLIPDERAVEVWGPLERGGQSRRIEAATRLESSPEFPGLTLDLDPIWAA